MSDTVDIFQEFLQESDVDFVKYFSQSQPNKSGLEELKQTIAKYDRNQLDNLWERLHSICTSTLLGCCHDDEHESSEKAMETFNTACTILSGVCVVAGVTLEKNFEHVPKDLFKTLLILNEILVTLPNSHFKLKSKIANLCETWWVKELNGRDQLFLNLLIFLLQKNTSEKFVKVDLKRLWMLRHGYKLINFENDTGIAVKALMEKCMISTNFLDVNDGKKILSLILCLNESTILDFHAAVKSKLPFCTRKQARSYAEVYYKAWCCIDGSMKDKLENNCIQDFMFHAIHAKINIPNSPAIVLKEFLNSFHLIKQRDVNDLLFKLYEPILWRSFKVPNSVVRFNAASILFRAFPLECRQLSIEENDEWLQKQFSIMKDLLMDPSSDVRMCSVNGVCSICTNYWEIIPCDIIQSFVTLLVDELRFDVSSALVRVAVFKGLMLLLNNPLSHSYLKTILPRICNSFHDTCETVRIAVVELLLKVKNFQSIDYWNLVPSEHLFARLAIDTPPISRRIVKLLFNSFFPKNDAELVALNRAIFLVKNHPDACRKFYRYAQELTSIEEAVALLLKISICVKDYLRKEVMGKKKSAIEINTEDFENIENVQINSYNDDKGNDKSFVDRDVIIGLIDVAGIIWAGVHDKLLESENKKLLKKLHAAYKDIVGLFFRCCKDDSSWDSLFYLTSFLPSSHSTSLRKHCLIRMRSLSADASSELYGSYVVNLCKWNSVDELTEILSRWLTAGLTEDKPRQSSKRSRKSVQIVEPYESHPILACDILIWMLEERYCQKILLSCRDSLLPCWKQLQMVLALIEKRVNSVPIKNKHCTEEFFIQAFQTFCRVTIMLHKLPEHDSVELINKLIPWTSEIILPNLVDEVKPQFPINMCVEIIKCLLLVVSDMVLISLANDAIITSITQFSINLLNTRLKITFMENISRLCHQLIEYGCSRTDKTEMTRIIGLATSVISCIIDVLAKRSRDSDDNERVPESMKQVFTSIFSTFFRHKMLDFISFKEIIATIVVGLLVDVKCYIEKHEGFDKTTLKSDLPMFTQFFLFIFTSRVNLITLFLAEIRKCIASEELLESPGPLVVAVIVYTLYQEKKCSKISLLKTTVSETKEFVKIAQSVGVNDLEDKNLSLEGNYLKTASELLNLIVENK